MSQQSLNEISEASEVVSEESKKRKRSNEEFPEGKRDKVSQSFSDSTISPFSSALSISDIKQRGLLTYSSDESMADSSTASPKKSTEEMAEETRAFIANLQTALEQEGIQKLLARNTKELAEKMDKRVTLVETQTLGNTSDINDLKSKVDELEQDKLVNNDHMNVNSKPKIIFCIYISHFDFIFVFHICI
jgi:hypothetical protein